MNFSRDFQTLGPVAIVKIIIVAAWIAANQVFIGAIDNPEAGTGSCHLRELELCCVGATSLFQNPNGVPMTDQEFRRQCELLDESIDCHDSYSERCLTKPQRQIVEMFAGAVIELEKDFCKSGTDMRIQYAKHVECFREIQKKYQRVCVIDFQVALEPIHKLEMGARMSTGCCAINRFKDCIMSKIEDECGEDASNLVQSWYTRAFGNIINVTCRNYDSESGACQKFLPKVGTRPYNGRNTSAISRVISSYSGSASMLDLS